MPTLIDWGARAGVGHAVIRHAGANIGIRNPKKENNIMIHNVGGVDRVIRIVIGVVALIAGFAVIESTGWQIVAIVVGAGVLLTAFVGFCPVNRLLRINTYRHRTDQP